MSRHPRGVTAYVAAYDATATDPYGDPVASWAAPFEVPGCAFDPGSSAEPREPGTERVETEPTLYLPYGAMVGPLDKVTVRGLVYQVDGVSRQWENPFTGVRPGSVVTLRKVTG